MTEKSANEALLVGLTVNGKLILGDKVENDIIIVTGVESDLIGSRGKRNRLYNIEGVVSVEGRCFDSNDAGDLSESLPIIICEVSAANRGLEIEVNEFIPASPKPLSEV